MNSTPGPGGYPSIQDALDWAEDDAANHIEFVMSTGRFNESINFTYRNISLISSDPTNPAVVQATILDGNGQDVLTFVGSQAESCIVSGISITGGARGIYCESAAPTISHCVIRNNQQGGLYCCNNSQPDVSNCFFYRNSSSDNGDAIYNDSSNPTITNCVLVENKADNGGAMSICHGLIDRCTIIDNTATLDPKQAYPGALLLENSAGPA